MQSRLSHEAALQIMRKLLSPSCHLARRRRVYVDSRYRRTSMKTVMDSVNEITPELLHPKRSCGAVNGRAAEPAASAVRETDVVLPETCQS